MGLLPGLVRSGDDADIGAGGDEVVVQFADTGRLVWHAGHTRVDKVVAPLAKADNGAVEGPVVRDLVCVAPSIPRRGTACKVVSMDASNID